MVSLAEQPQHISIINPVGPFGFNKTDDKASGGPSRCVCV
jgi:hypothetical protein